MPDGREGQLNLGARVQGTSGTDFTVWAPLASEVRVKLIDRHVSPYVLERHDGGYFSGRVSGAHAGDRYVYLLDEDTEQPDPASRYQPQGVHGASAVIDPHTFHWSDEAWRGLPLDRFIIYELHVGTFTPEGT